MSRLELAKIPALTFYQDVITTSRRTSPLPQLICVGRPCRLYTPDVVRCVNLGGSGTEVDWKCEADLPDSLKFGRVDVSCEGWSGPGDPYVLKGSCSLEYRLVQLDKSFTDSPIFPARSWLKSTSISEVIAVIFWTVLILFILYTFLKSCLHRDNPNRGPRQNHNTSGSSSGRFPGTYRGNDTPPPPYSKNSGDGSRWTPGFWTGAALGSLGTYLASGRRQETANPEPRLYDWERTRGSGSSFFGGRRAPTSSDDRGEGSSNLGAMKRSTGYGGSSVR